MSVSGTEPLEWSLIVAVNDPRVLHGTLLQSPALTEGCEVILKRFHTCAGKAYNEGIAQATREILVFAHQDVYLPESWLKNLAGAIRRLELFDPQWGVLGPVGVTGDERIAGHVYSTGLQDYVGAPFGGFYPAMSLDEMVLVLRRSSGLRFDEALPGFHLYGTDICLEARRRGLSSYIVPAFCIHNSNGVARLPRPFWQAYLFLRRKWRSRLPVATCCTRITRDCWPLIRKSARDFLRASLRLDRVGTRCADPKALYKSLEAEKKSGIQHSEFKMIPEKHLKPQASSLKPFKD